MSYYGLNIAIYVSNTRIYPLFSCFWHVLGQMRGVLGYPIVNTTGTMACITHAHEYAINIPSFMLFLALFAVFSCFWHVLGQMRGVLGYPIVITTGTMACITPCP